MAKHKKKKVNRQQLDKIVQAQARNEFQRNLKKMLKVIDCEGVFDLISERLMSLMYTARGFPVRVMGAEENTFDTDDLKWFKKAVIHKFKTKLIDFEMGGPKIDLYTISSVGLALKFFSKPIIEQNLGKHPQLAEKLTKYDNFDKFTEYILDHLWHTTENICLKISDLKTRIYWVENRSTKNLEKMKLGFDIIIHGELPEKICITIDRERHLASRVGWTFRLEPVWLSIKPESLGLRSVGKDNLIDVYIQDHALNRLIERNDCIYKQYIWGWLCVSFGEIKYHINKDNGKYMIEFRVFDIKTGYLVAQIIDAKLIIQTFLLLTYDGTPEGKKLHAHTGLCKSDIQYLKLDRLSTFISPELHQNQKIRTIFKEAGCDSLFQIKAECDKDGIMLRKPASASLIEDYLMLNEERPKDDDWRDEYEEGAWNMKPAKVMPPNPPSAS
jgi:hypothetical protein